MENRESCVFYKSFYDAIKGIPTEEQLKLYNAIFEYMFENKQIEENGIAKSMFTLIKPNIDSANKRYATSIENGKKGGNPNFKKGKSNPYYDVKDNPVDNPKITQQQPKNNPRDNLNVNDNVDDNVNVNDNENDTEEDCQGETKIFQKIGLYTNRKLDTQSQTKLDNYQNLVRELIRDNQFSIIDKLNLNILEKCYIKCKGQTNIINYLKSYILQEIAKGDSK